MTNRNHGNLIDFRREGVIARVTLNRPEQHNALSAALTDQLIAVLEELRNDENVHCVVLAGGGESFCSGRDVNELRTMLVEGIDLPLTPVPAGRMSLLVRSLPQVVIAQVHGNALGEGLDLALACDFTIVAADAVLGDPHLQQGVVPGAGTWRMPRLIGAKRAAQLLYLGRRISGSEAAEWGLVTQAVPAADLDRTVGELSDQIATLAPFSLRATKQAMRLAEDAPLDQTLDSIARSRTIAAHRTAEARS